MRLPIIQYRSYSSIQTLPRTMLAAMIEKHGEKLIVRADVPTPEIGKGQILVKMKACGVCHSDIHTAHGDWPMKSRVPIIPGHEGVGVVVATGDEVSDVRLGDRVGIPWIHSTCGSCEYCSSGWETLCTRKRITGYTVNGCYSEFVKAQSGHVVKIPDNLSFVQTAPLLCAGLTSYKALKQTDTLPGQFCTIVGAAGGLGHLAIQYAKALGLVVVAIDIGEDKLSYCRTLGADFVVDATDKDHCARVVQHTGGGSHGVLCLATNTDAFTSAISMTRMRGTIVCVGLPTGAFPVNIFELVNKCVTIRGSSTGSRQDLVEALDFASRGLVRCTTSTDSLLNINDIFYRLANNKVVGRVVVEFS